MRRDGGKWFFNSHERWLFSSKELGYKSRIKDKREKRETIKYHNTMTMNFVLQVFSYEGHGWPSQKVAEGWKYLSLSLSLSIIINNGVHKWYKEYTRHDARGWFVFPGLISFFDNSSSFFFPLFPLQESQHICQVLWLLAFPTIRPRMCTHTWIDTPINITEHYYYRIIRSFNKLQFAINEPKNLPTDPIRFIQRIYWNKLFEFYVFLFLILINHFQAEKLFLTFTASRIVSIF